MRAVECTKYGPPEVLKLVEIEKPVPKDNEVCIKIMASAVTASDCYIRGFNLPVEKRFPQTLIMTISMKVFVGFRKPRNSVLGLVLAGIVESTGKNVKRFKTGDRVYGFTGYSFGGYAEYKCMSEKPSIKGTLEIIPSNMSFEEAAAIVYPGIFATHFILKGNIHDEQRVLIYGASGAIGTTALQLAKYFGANVTGVCSTQNIALVKSLGADAVIDYTQKSVLNKDEKYDFILDAVGKIKTSKFKELCKKALTENGQYISVDDGGPKLSGDYLFKIKEVIEAGAMKAVIDRSYPLESIVEAHRYVDLGHKKGNVVINVSSEVN